MTEGLYTKRHEHFPLLMVNAGSGDGGKTSPKSLSSMWNVTSYTPRRSCFDRVPEFVASCWMTFVLLGIIFMVFYSIGMAAYKRDPFILMKTTNVNKSANNVFLHHLLPRSSDAVNFANYADYISDLSRQYPSLQFNVIFLIDDSPFIQYGVGFRHSSRFMMPRLPRYTLPLGEWEKQEIKDFNKLHPNVRATVMFMSGYMAKTPLKNKWHMIPTSILAFYARVFSVWQHGGIGIDLSVYNNQRKRNIRDWRLESILKEHDDGIIEPPTNELPKLVMDRQTNRESENATELNRDMYGLLQHFLSSAMVMFNINSTTTVTDKPEAEKVGPTPVSGGHRMKRDVSEQAILSSDNQTKENHMIMDLIPPITGDKKNVYKVTSNETLNNTVPVLAKNIADSDNVNKSDGQEGIIILYDISLMVGPPMEPDSRKSRSRQVHTGTVNIDGDGLFVSATTKYHPFLYQIIDAGCRKSTPRVAIFDALITQCNGYIRDDLYCNNIHVM